MPTKDQWMNLYRMGYRLFEVLPQGVMLIAPSGMLEVWQHETPPTRQQPPTHTTVLLFVRSIDPQMYMR